MVTFYFFLENEFCYSIVGKWLPEEKSAKTDKNTASVTEKKKRDKYTERKRYQHLLTKSEKAIVYSSLAEKALSTCLLNQPAASLHQKEHWRPSSPVAEVYAVPRRTFLIVQIRSQKLLGKLARNTTMKIALTPKRRRKHEALAEEQIEWPKFFFLDRPDMTYINLEAKRSCARWKSRGIVGVTNG